MLIALFDTVYERLNFQDSLRPPRTRTCGHFPFFKNHQEMKRARENSENKKKHDSTKKAKTSTWIIKTEYVKTFSESLLKACSLGKADLARTLCSNGADPERE